MPTEGETTRDVQVSGMQRELSELKAGLFVTHRYLNTASVAVIATSWLGILVAVWIGLDKLEDKVEIVSERNDRSIEMRFGDLDRRLGRIEGRLVASIDSGFSRLHAQIESTAVQPGTSLVAWKPPVPAELAPAFADLFEKASPVGIYTLSPDFWQVSSEMPADKLEALRLLLEEGALEPVRPEGQ